MTARPYEGKDVRIAFDARRCIHAAECVNGLPKVFDPQAKPWIQPDGASADEIASTVRRCPSGALHAETPDGASLVEADARASVTLGADGPVYLRGTIRLEDAQGNVIAEDTRMALCRCGASKNKPFCDNSHVEAGFADTGDVNRELEAAEVEAGPITVRLAANGPALVDGAYVVVDAQGAEHPLQKKGALCRCGASNAKPFCDGSHKGAGFEG